MKSVLLVDDLADVFCRRSPVVQEVLERRAREERDYAKRLAVPSQEKRVELF
ncbi:MAG: hypothetical protein PHT48_06460 [Dechloromonas sp.]|nr:hypothetical protein [Dechloromonas sp.]